MKQAVNTYRNICFPSTKHSFVHFYHRKFITSHICSNCYTYLPFACSNAMLLCEIASYILVWTIKTWLINMIMSNIYVNAPSKYFFFVLFSELKVSLEITCDFRTCTEKCGFFYYVKVCNFARSLKVWKDFDKLCGTMGAFWSITNLVGIPESISIPTYQKNENCSTCNFVWLIPAILLEIILLFYLFIFIRVRIYECSLVKQNNQNTYSQNTQILQLQPIQRNSRILIPSPFQMYSIINCIIIH